MYNDAVTFKQKTFIASLVSEREISGHLATLVREFDALEEPTKRNASNLIDHLIRAPKKAAAPKVREFRPVAEDPKAAEVRTLLAELPASRYALKAEQIELAAPGIKLYGNDLLFVEVHEHRRTKRRRLFRVHGAPGRFSRSFLGSLEDNLTVLRTIAAAPAEAAQRFAHHYQCCARCAAELTDHESRRLGIGPTCRKYFGI